MRHSVALYMTQNDSNCQTTMRSRLHVDVHGNVLCDVSDDEESLNSTYNQQSTRKRSTSPTTNLDIDICLNPLNSQRALEATSAEDCTHNLEFKPVPFLSPSVPTCNNNVAQRFAPPGVAYATMVGFEQEDCIVLFGGITNNNQPPLNDTWVYEVTSMRWFRLDTIDVVSDNLKAIRKLRGFTGDVLPPPRAGHCAVGIRDVDIAPSRSSNLMSNIDNEFGNSTIFGNQPYIDTNTRFSKSLRVGLSESKNISGGSGNGSGHLIKDPDPWSYRPTMVVFGGANMSLGVTYNDLWIFDVQCRSWREISPLGSAPSPRWMCTAAALEQRVFIFGGESTSFQVLNDLHMYDHILGRWRELRTVVPCPRPRMGHAAVTVGGNMIIIGGVDKASYINQAAEMTAAAVVQAREAAEKKKKGNSSFFDKPETKKILTNKKNSISDVWSLDMRTLLWRELGTSDKMNSPFAWRNHPSGEDIFWESSISGKIDRPLSTTTIKPSEQLGKGSLYSSSEDDTAPLLPIEGHVLIPFDNHIVVYGGNNAAGKLNTNIFSFDSVAEKWSFHGKIDSTSANTANKAEAQRLGKGPFDSTFAAVKPQPRAHHCACVIVQKSLPNSLSKFDKIASNDNETNFHLSEEKETGPLLDYFCFTLAKQVASHGILTVYKNKPVINHTIRGYIFGGTSFPRNVSDLWAVSFNPVKEETPDSERLNVSPLLNQKADNDRVDDLMYKAARAGIVTFGEDILIPQALEKKKHGKGRHTVTSPKCLTAFSEEGTYAKSQRQPDPTFYFPLLGDRVNKNSDTLKASYSNKFIAPHRKIRSRKVSLISCEKDENDKSINEDSIDESFKQQRLYERMVSLREDILGDAHKYILGLSRPSDNSKKSSDSLGSAFPKCEASKRLKQRAQSYISTDIPLTANWKFDRRRKKTNL